MLRRTLTMSAAIAALGLTAAVAQDAAPQSGETRPATNANTVDPTLPATVSSMDGQASSTSAASPVASTAGSDPHAGHGSMSSSPMSGSSSTMSGSTTTEGQTYGSGTTGYASATGGADPAVGGGGGAMRLSAVDVSGAVIAAAPVAVAPKTDLDASKYVMKAAASDLYEIESSRVALERSQSGAVRRYAQTMIDHHTMTSQQLTATVRNMPAPQLEPHQRDMIADLRAAPAEMFDRMYVNQQLASHMNALSVHGGYMKAGDEAALRQLATQATPVVASHLETVWNMSDMPQNLAAARDDSTRLAQAGGQSYRGYTVYGPNARTEVSASADMGGAAYGTAAPSNAANGWSTPSTSATGSGSSTSATYGSPDAVSNATATPSATVGQSLSDPSTAVPGQTGAATGVNAGARNYQLDTGNSQSDVVNGGTLPNDRTGMGGAATRLGPTSPMNGTAGANVPDSDTSSGEDDPNEEPTP